MKKLFAKFFLIALLAMPLGACSSASSIDNDISYNQVSDPLETVNRAIFSFNGVVDKYVFKPVAQGYTAVLPELARDGIQNFFRNLLSPTDLANQVLQGDIDGAATTTARFLMNSTVGIAGFIDAAEKVGIPYEGEDFGQTLAVWGIPSGPYVVLPFMGPSTVRDFVGMAADFITNPVHWNAEGTGVDDRLIGQNVATIIDQRARLIDPLDQLQANSLDYYAAVRSVYAQFRSAQINDVQEGAMMGASTASLDDYDDYAFMEDGQ